MMKHLTPRIIKLNKKVLAGKCLSMSFSNNRTHELWHSFMPFRNSVPGRVGGEMISLQVYPESFDFQPDEEFVKWALIEVEESTVIPDGLERFDLPGGLYAVFDYTGSAADPAIFRYIFGSWIPSSDYLPDNRPHFEILGPNYSNTSPESEEEIWIPVKPKEAIS